MWHKTWRFPLIAMLTLFVWAALPSAAKARAWHEDRIVFGETYIVERGQVLDGNLTVLGGKAVIQPGGEVTGDIRLIGGNLRLMGRADGDVTVVGGNAYINGQVGGDLKVTGGTALLGAHAAVAGRTQAIGGQIEREGGPEEPPFRPPQEFVAPHSPEFSASGLGWLGKALWRGLWAFLYAVVLAILAALVVLVLPDATRTIAKEVEETPLITGAVGLLTLALLPGLIVILVITLLLIPLVPVVLIVVGVAALWGWIALSLFLTERALEAMGLSWPPVLSAAVGTFLLTLIAGALRIIPCIGWVPGALVAAFGLGGALVAAWHSKEGWKMRRQQPQIVTAPVEQTPPTTDESH